MAKSNTSANDYVALLYNGTPIANIADNAAVAPLTNLFIRAHTAEPGAAGNQSTNEAAYTGYTAATVARTTAGFTCAAGVVTLVADAAFGLPIGTGAALTHWSTGVALTGATKIIHRGVFGSRQGPFTAVVSGNVITIPGHTVIVNDNIAFYQPSGTALPGGIAEGTLYFVKTVASNDITISATSGGTAITITAAGDGLAYKVTPLTPQNAVTPKMSSGQIIYEE